MRNVSRALFVLVLGVVALSLPASAQCDDIFTNFTGSSTFYLLADPNHPGSNYFAGPSCDGTVDQTPTGVLVTGDLVLFDVEVGQTITWTTCGLAAFDTYIRLWEDNSGAGFPLLAENDDDFSCPSSIFHSTLTWTSTLTGSVWLSVNEFPCNPDNQLPYDLLFTCQPGSQVCGNGTVEPPEECDDGNTVSGDGCDANCIAEFCGDGIVQPGLGEECDDGNTINADGCQGNCLLPVCGDGILDPGEQCDDGNTIDADGCQGNCLIPFCGDGIVDAGEVCDDGNGVDGDGCDSNCTPTSCGNGIVTAGEQCDDGNTIDGDGCQGNCLLPFCGDGILDAGEGCDDGNNIDADGCSANCIVEGACCSDGMLTQSDCFITTPAGCAADGNSALYLGDRTECTADIECTALLVRMEEMSAEATDEGVMVRWTTGAEIDTVGFRLLREMPSAPESREKALAMIATIAAAGNSIEGHSYTFLDNSKESADAVQYFIEDIDIYGKVTRHGPIEIDRGEREAPTRRVKPAR